MATVTIHPPKTPVTSGSMGIAKNTVPNVCKMPGPPAPFVPTPLPNIGKSGMSPSGYSTSVKIEGNAVAIFGASFNSMGDVASQGTGGGLISMNTQGPTKFIGPGSLTVKIEGKAVHLLGEPMFNNCGPSGNPPNAATMTGLDQASGSATSPTDDECKKVKSDFKLVTGTHKENESVKDVANQSHHVLQDEALKNRGVPSNDGFAVLLADSHSGTEHRVITNLQNARRDNKRFGRGGAMPATTFGELKKLARADLVAGLAGKRQNAEGRAMTQKEAETAADCLVKEAEDTSKKAAKRNGKTLNDNSPVDQPGGCFVAGTLVHLASGGVRRVEALRRGDRLLGAGGERDVVRLDTCRHRVVELSIGGDRLTLAMYHRLVAADGFWVRAAALRPGDRVATRDGLRSIDAVRVLEAPGAIYRVGVDGSGVCFVGRAAVLAEVTSAGPAIVRCEPVSDFDAREL
jgi:Domain of unknown function (DUF4150)